MKKWLVAITLVLAFYRTVQADAVVKLDSITLDSEALENGCSTSTLSTADLEDCHYRVCYSLLKSLWLQEESNRRNLEPDTESMEVQQREFEKSHVGDNLTFTVLPRLKFQRQAIQLYRDNRAQDKNYGFAALWKDVATSATELEIPERALRALVTAYGEDEQRFLDFLKMFPDDHETALARSRNSWEREARRVTLEKKLSPDDKLTTGELEKARAEWGRELEIAPDATEKMLIQRKRAFHVNSYFLKLIEEKADFAEQDFRKGLLQWVSAKVIAPDKAVFGE